MNNDKLIMSINVGELKDVVKEAVSEVQKINKEILTLNECCFLTGMAPSSIYKLTSSGKIPHWKKGNKLRFDKTKIIEWLRLEG